MFKLLAIILVAQGAICDHQILGPVTATDALVRVWRTEESFKITVTNLQDEAIDNHISYKYYCGENGISGGGMCGEFAGPYADQFPLIHGQSVQLGRRLHKDPSSPYYSVLELAMFTCEDPRVEIYEFYQEDPSHEAWIKGYETKRQLTTLLIIDKHIQIGE